MKDTTLTIRMPALLRRRIEDLARREGRSLSQEAQRLIEAGLAARRGITDSTDAGQRGLSGALQGGVVPTLADFAAVRADLSDSLAPREAHAGKLPGVVPGKRRPTST